MKTLLDLQLDLSSVFIFFLSNTTTGGTTRIKRLLFPFLHKLKDFEMGILGGPNANHFIFIVCTALYFIYWL